MAFLNVYFVLSLRTLGKVLYGCIRIHVLHIFYVISNLGKLYYTTTYRYDQVPFLDNRKVHETYFKKIKELY